MKIYITGEITDKPFEGCYCPDDLKNALEGVNENEPLEVEITSEGGSVFAGIQIANILNRWKGGVTTHAVGFVASIATVILMAGKKMVVDSNCFCLIHLPWSVVQGNKNDLEKEIDALEKCKHAMMSYYMRHSKVSAEEIEKCLENETWLLGSEFAELFDVEILESDETLDIAAKFDLSKYKNIPTRILNMKNKEEIVKADAKPIEEEEKKEEVVEETKEEPSTEEKKEETSTSEEPVEEKQEEPVEEKQEETSEEEETIKQYEEKIAELEAKIAELEEELEKQKEVKPDEETVSKAECEKRVSGMQASMQKQINDFKNQLQAKDEELTKAKADITRLTSDLEKSNGELSTVTSALEEKTKALDMLNANVNSKADELPTMTEGLAKCSTPAEKVAFLKSGKYIR